MDAPKESTLIFHQKAKEEGSRITWLLVTPDVALNRLNGEGVKSPAVEVGWSLGGCENSESIMF